MDERLISQILEDSKTDKTPFLDAIRQLRNLGVWGYRVDVNSHSLIVFDQNASFIQIRTQNVLIQRQFIRQKIIDAIRFRQNLKLSYKEFMIQIGESGVFDYVVDIAGKKVIYRGLFEQYEEKMVV
ncbi:DUF1398 family protein [Candidatus Micrarchaeota archaeon]|nr:DUF1398 family protein [Candidatus Micrarchaeota archaeon]